MKIVRRRIFDIGKKVCLAVILLMIASIVISMAQGKHPKFFGYQVLRVLTSSMQPVIHENTCIIIKEVPEEELKQGDIITFISENSQIYGYYNTHRIHEIVVEEDGTRTYITKGDAVAVVDEERVRFDQIAGVYVRELPGGELLGNFFVALSDSKIYFLVVMLPLLLCLISYVMDAVRYATGYYDEEDDETEENFQEDLDLQEENLQEKNLQKEKEEHLKSGKKSEKLFIEELEFDIIEQNED